MTNKEKEICGYYIHDHEWEKFTEEIGSLKPNEQSIDALELLQWFIDTFEPEKAYHRTYFDKAKLIIKQDENRHEEQKERNY